MPAAVRRRSRGTQGGITWPCAAGSKMKSGRTCSVQHCAPAATCRTLPMWWIQVCIACHTGGGYTQGWLYPSRLPMQAPTRGQAASRPGMPSAGGSSRGSVLLLARLGAAKVCLASRQSRNSWTAAEAAVLLCSRNRASPACTAHSTHLLRGSNAHSMVQCQFPYLCLAQTCWQQWSGLQWPKVQRGSQHPSQMKLPALPCNQPLCMQHWLRALSAVPVLGR